MAERNGSVGIVGAGILGLTVAYRLAQAGVQVAVYERSQDLGGLVGDFDLGGRPADRFYHVVLPTDDRVRGLAEELGVGDRFRFRPVQVGFYDEGRLFSMSSIKEFLTFPLLKAAERVRLGAFVTRCQRLGDQDELDRTPLLEWLRRRSGAGVTAKLWEPLLDSKFDGRYDDLPATYMWSRTKRMSKTRDSAGREVMGWLEGGYRTLIDALAARIRELGGEIHAGTSVDLVAGGPDGATGIVVGGRHHSFDQVLCTLVPPQARTVLADGLAARIAPDRRRYLGVIALVLRTSRSVSPYYTLNITDRRIPLTTVVETTHVVDPGWAGGHLVYVCKYVDPTHPDLSRPAAEVQREYMGHLATLFPGLGAGEVLAASVQRARVVEPVHVLGGAANLPEMFPVPGLALASSAHVYPEVVNGQAVIGVAERAVAGIMERLPTRELVAA